MFGKVGNSAVRPAAMGADVQSSLYGTTIPVYLGRSRGRLYLIWAANYRPAPTSKFQSAKFPGVATYTESCDFLIGQQPIQSTLQWWQNGNAVSTSGVGAETVYDLVFDEITFTWDGSPIYSIDPTLLVQQVLAVTVDEDYSFPVNDYKGPGYASDPITKTGTWHRPMWPAWQVGPDPTGPRAWRDYPYIYGSIPQVEGGEIFLYHLPSSWIGKTLHIHYAASPIVTDDLTYPLTTLGLTYEMALGNNAGGEYTEVADNTAEQIIYEMYAGIGGAEVNMGMTGLFPNFSPEILGSFSYYPSGDCDFADMIEYSIKMGFTQSALLGPIANNQSWQPNTVVRYGEIITANNTGPFRVQRCIQAGITGPGPAPTFSATGGTVTDGTPPTQVTWQDIGTEYSVQYTLQQTGLGCFDFPGIVNAANFPGDALPFLELPFYTPGQYEDTVVIFTDCADDVTVSDGPGNTFSGLIDAVSPAGGVERVWVSTLSKMGPGYSMQVTSSGANLRQVAAFEISGVDTVYFNGSFAGTGTLPTGSVPISSDPDTTTFILAIVNTENGVIIDPEEGTPWTYFGNVTGDNAAVFYRKVSNPGTFAFSGAHCVSGNWTLALLAFQSSKVPFYPKPLGDIIDFDSLEWTRDQCRANGLIGSIGMDTQKPAKDYLKDFCDAAICAAVWSGFKYKFIPMSEVSQAGNGATYTAPTASGPVANLSKTNGDFISDSGKPTIKINIKSPITTPNIVYIQHPYRGAAYNDVVSGEPFTAAIAQYGTVKDSPRPMKCFQDVQVARKVAAVLSRRQNINRSTYSWTSPMKWLRLEAMDLITLSDPDLNLNEQPVVIQSVKENSNFELEFTAVDFVYGLNDPADLGVLTIAPYVPGRGNLPGNANAPIIFEGPPKLNAQPTAAQGNLIFMVSGASPDYGGVNILVSTDGGLSYSSIGTLYGNCPTGVLTADYPASADPDSVDTLSVDLTESLGSLQPFVDAQRDAFESICYIEGGGVVGTVLNTTPVLFGTGYVVGDQFTLDGGNNDCVMQVTDVGPGGAINGVKTIAQGTGYSVATSVTTTATSGSGSGYVLQIFAVGPVYPYELVAYAGASSTGAYTYDLPPTIRRAVYGAPAASAGVDHPAASRFGYLGVKVGGSGTTQISGLGGTLQWEYPAEYIGMTLNIKLQAFNTFGGQLQDESILTPYTYTLTGAGSGNSLVVYSVLSDADNSPNVLSALNNGDGTWTITQAACTVVFSSGRVHYNASSVTVPGPATLSSDTWYYVRKDQTFAGDQGTSNTCPQSADTSNQLEGQVGFTFMGSISIGADLFSTPGGWPTPGS